MATIFYCLQRKYCSSIVQNKYCITVEQIKDLAISDHESLWLEKVTSDCGEIIVQLDHENKHGKIIVRSECYASEYEIIVLSLYQ